MLAASPAAHAVQPDEIMSDPAQGSAGARAVARTALHGVPEPVDRRFRCAAGARLRLLVRERIAAGDSDGAGDRFSGGALRRVRAAEAAVQPATLLLWLLPPLALAGGGLALWIHSRRRSKPGRGRSGIVQNEGGGGSAAGTADRGGNAAGKAGLGLASGGAQFHRWHCGRQERHRQRGFGSWHFRSTTPASRTTCRSSAPSAASSTRAWRISARRAWIRKRSSRRA